MTSDANTVEPDPSDLNAVPPAAEVAEEIVSVNKRVAPNNKVAKGLFLLLVGAILVGVLAWFSQDWLNTRKAQLKANSGPKVAEDTSRVFNPEKTGAAPPMLKLGAESGAVPPSLAAASAPIQPGAVRDDGIRPLRGADGKVMLNAQGRALGVDRSGNVIEVPAIAAVVDDPASRRTPLPGQPVAGQGGAGQVAPARPPSRYGGSLFVGEPVKPSDANATAQAPVTPSKTIAQIQAEQIAEILRSAGMGGAAGQGTRAGFAPSAPSLPTAPGVPAGVVNAADNTRPGTVGSTLYTSATPVAVARRIADQNLMLPKGRQADCILTGRIVDEVPGFTSCVLAQNLYSDNGRVLLLERGSELSGEYGVTNQLGLERLFVTWNRVKTPDGIEVDLSSPGADRLGTSGLPGHLDNRWGARIGAALLLSFVKDVTVAIINNQSKESTGTSVNIATPGQNSLNASSGLAEEVIKQTIKVRPRLTINEGDRISIYVARDLDFSPVYALKMAGVTGSTRVLTK